MVEVQEEVEMVLVEVALVEAAQEASDCKMNKPCTASNHTLLTIHLVFVCTNLCILHKMRNPCNVAKYTSLPNQKALLHTILRTAHLLHSHTSSTLRSHTSSFARVWMSRPRFYM